MEIQGQLRDDIKNGNIVLFLGAGASESAGLLDSKGLANYLFGKAGNPSNFIEFKADFPRLVSYLYKDSNFGRRWINSSLIEYFLNSKNYTNLETHSKIFDLDIKAIYTTNYDYCLELAENAIGKRGVLFPIVNPKEESSIFSELKGKIKYYKIHGCCHELEMRPSNCPNLVITQSDFRESIARNKLFLDELKRYAFYCSIVFLGFQAQKVENNHIMASIIEAYQNLASSFHQSFKAYVVLINVKPDIRHDIEEAGLTLLEGTFEEFINSANELRREEKIPSKIIDTDREILLDVAGRKIRITHSEYEQHSSQFTFYYDGYLDNEVKKLEGYQKKRIVELWKSNPTDMILSKGYYINRTLYSDILIQLKKVIEEIKISKSPQLLVITGKRASGKSAIAKQIMSYIYHELHQPSLVLSHHASYFIESPELEKQISISGWDGKQIDKFLSLLSHDDEDNITIVPVILADHLFHRTRALDNLKNYLENHNKPCLLIIILNIDQYEELRRPESLERFFQLNKYSTINIPHTLDDQEIDKLFEIVGRLEPRVLDNKDVLLERAKNPKECNRDLLLILYTWFDAQFRRLDEIIAEEIEKLNNVPKIRDFYLSVAVFHQYNFQPRISVCAKALGIGIEEFTDLRRQPVFKALIDIESNLGESSEELVATRHSEFSRRVLNALLPKTDSQIDLICRVLSECSYPDLQFVRDFLNYTCRYEASLKIDQVTRIKEATEKKLDKDYVLNHQFGAYLIRERTKLEDAADYLERALEESPENGSILHSLGNLYYNLYKNAVSTNMEKAEKYYTLAKVYFERSRALTITRDEHAYYTEIDMISYRINNTYNDDKTKAILKAEQHSLIYEALQVIPIERQNLLRNLIGQGTPFINLPLKDKKLISLDILTGKASPFVLEYYARSLLSIPDPRNWEKLSELVTLYWDLANNDPAIAIILSLISKHAFIKNANTRFEFLRGFLDELIRYQEMKVNFYLLAQYSRLIQTDALVLEKFDFLRSIIGDIINIFRESKPRFLKDEYILEKKYYIFDENNQESMKKLFMGRIDFSQSKNARRYHSLVYLDYSDDRRFFDIELDPISRYHIGGVYKEVAVRGKVDLNFCIKHRYDGFFGTDFRT